MTQWNNLRLETSVMTLLQAYRQRLETAHMRDPAKCPALIPGRRVSLSDAIRVLVGTQLNKRVRMQRYRENNRARRQPPRLYTEDTETRTEPQDIIALPST